jgi:large subunit ribosomal protein L6
MSRIGRLPVEIPAGVTVKLEGNTLNVKGPKGELTQQLHPAMTIAIEGNQILVTRPSDDKDDRALHGLTRALIANMVTGVNKGFTKGLEIVGTGYRAAKTGAKLTLVVGYSHPVEIDPPAGIEFEVPNQAAVVVKGADKGLVGQVAANIRAIREPEMYLGKGIRYAGEKIKLKPGKAGKAGGK